MTISSRSRLLAPSLVLAAIAISAEVALADRVILRDGQVLTGEVIDAGDSILLKQKLGGRTIKKSLIERIDYDESKANPEDGEPPDIIIQTGERILEGRAKISPDGKEVWVTIRGQQIIIPRDHVREIRWRGKRNDDAPGKSKAEIESKVQALLAQLSSEDIDARKAAREQILELGVFSIPTIEKTLAELPKDDPKREVLQEVIAQHALKSVITSEIENKVEKVYLRLSSLDPETRRSALSDIALVTPDSAPAIMLHFLRNDTNPDIRALCVSQLSLLRAFDELAQVMKVPNGRLRLAAAIALGEHGILAGIPILIDILALNTQRYLDIVSDESKPEEERAEAQETFTQLNRLKVLADLKLKEFTGQDFGFSIIKEAEGQIAAVDRWRSWWDEEGDRLLEQSVKMVQGGEESEVETKERKEAIEFWAKGNERMVEYEAIRGADKLPLSGPERREKFEQVAFFFQRSIQADPTFVRARIALAYVFYNELERLDDARSQLDSALKQTLEVDSKLPRCLAYYHLAQLSQREGDFKSAELKLYDAIKIASVDEMDDSVDLRLDLHLALGHLYLDWALIRDTAAVEATTVEASKKEGGPAAGPEAEISEKAKVHMENVTSRLKNAQASFKRGLEEIYKQDTKYRAQAQNLLATKDTSVRKAAVLQSLRANIKALSLRSAAFYYGLGRVDAGLNLSRAAAQNFTSAARFDPSNESYQAARKYWEGVVRDLDRAQARADAASPTTPSDDD